MCKRPYFSSSLVDGTDLSVRQGSAETQPERRLRGWDSGNASGARLPVDRPIPGAPDSLPNNSRFIATGKQKQGEHRLPAKRGLFAERRDETGSDEATDRSSSPYAYWRWLSTSSRPATPGPVGSPHIPAPSPRPARNGRETRPPRRASLQPLLNPTRAETGIVRRLPSLTPPCSTDERHQEMMAVYTVQFIPSRGMPGAPSYALRTAI